MAASISTNSLLNRLICNCMCALLLLTLHLHWSTKFEWPVYNHWPMANIHFTLIELCAFGFKISVQDFCMCKSALYFLFYIQCELAFLIPYCDICGNTEAIKCNVIPCAHIEFNGVWTRNQIESNRIMLVSVVKIFIDFYKWNSPNGKHLNVLWNRYGNGVYQYKQIHFQRFCLIHKSLSVESNVLRKTHRIATGTIPLNWLRLFTLKQYEHFRAKIRIEQKRSKFVH